MKPLREYTKELAHFLSQRPPQKIRNEARFPKLTIITPSYNQGDFLERTILSVLNQGYPNLEYIIMDGGSTDQSVEVIKKYEKYLAHWASERDAGQVDALNKSLRIATGDWVSFQNSDDVYFPNTFSRFAELIRKHPKADMLYGDLFMIDPQDNVIELLKTNAFSFTSQVTEGMQVHNQSLFFKRELVTKFGEFDQSFRFAFDYEFITRFASKPSISLVRGEGLAGALRVHPDAKSSTIANVGREEHQKVVEQYEPMVSNFFPAKMRYLWCRVRKMVLLASEMDVAYIRHRLGRKEGK